MTESELQARILLRFGAVPDTRLFRNTVGEGWVGKVAGKTRDSVTLLHPRYVTFGLAVDSADLIGWHRGRFLAIEVKDEKGILRKGQERFIDVVNGSGGVAGVARSLDDVARLLL